MSIEKANTPPTEAGHPCVIWFSNPGIFFDSEVYEKRKSSIIFKLYGSGVYVPAFLLGFEQPHPTNMRAMRIALDALMQEGGGVKDDGGHPERPSWRRNWESNDAALAQIVAVKFAQACTSLAQACANDK